LAVRASKKLKGDELFLTGFAATRLRMELDRVPLWRGDNVSIKQLVHDFARYLYLPRLKDSGVLLQSIGDGLALLTWGKDSFAFAESYDETSGRYRGLRCGQMVPVSSGNLTGVIVKPDIARRQFDAEVATAPPSPPLEAAQPEQGLMDNQVGSVTQSRRTGRPLWPPDRSVSMGRLRLTRQGSGVMRDVSLTKSSRICRAWWDPRSRLRSKLRPTSLLVCQKTWSVQLRRIAEP
jgi:hypothetical protein